MRVWLQRCLHRAAACICHLSLSLTHTPTHTHGQHTPAQTSAPWKKHPTFAVRVEVGGAEPDPRTEAWVHRPSLFAWGRPTFLRYAETRKTSRAFCPSTSAVLSMQYSDAHARAHRFVQLCVQGRCFEEEEFISPQREEITFYTLFTRARAQAPRANTEGGLSDWAARGEGGVHLHTPHSSSLLRILLFSDPRDKNLTNVKTTTKTKTPLLWSPPAVPLLPNDRNNRLSRGPTNPSEKHPKT